MRTCHRVDVHNHIVPGLSVEELASEGIVASPGLPFPGWFYLDSAFETTGAVMSPLNSGVLETRPKLRFILSRTAGRTA